MLYSRLALGAFLLSTGFAEEQVPVESFAQDDECYSRESCAVNALQMRAKSLGEQASAVNETWGSCAQYGCSGHYHHGRGCQCNSHCGRYKDCCYDYASKCLKAHSDDRHDAPTKDTAATSGDSAATAMPASPAAAFGTSFKCTSSLDLGSVTMAGNKGMALDDDTFKECSNGIPAYFPNTDTAVKSLRLFKAWDPEWPEENRVPAWKNLAKFVKANDIKVLLGTEVTCNKSLDAQSWTWSKALLKMLGPDHVMGLGIGNELELLYTLGNRRKVAPVTPQCIEELWSGRRLWKQFQATVEEFDDLGFSSVPVTSVFGGYALAGSPFVNTMKSQVNTFVKQALAKYSGRFVFTFNFYPYFDTNMHLDKGGHSCNGALTAATNWGNKGFVPSILRAARSRVAMVAPGAKVWLGETGWSSPFAPSLESQMARCPDWSSKETLTKFYTGFLKWDMAGADHVFYFTMRNSEVFGIREYFGLIDTCASTTCKL